MRRMRTYTARFTCGRRCASDPDRVQEGDTLPGCTASPYRFCKFVQHFYKMLQQKLLKIRKRILKPGKRKEKV